MLGLGSDTFLWEDTCVQKSEYWLISRSRPIRGDDRWNSNKRNKEKTNKLSDKTYLSIFMFVWGWQTYHSSLTAKKRKSGEKKLSLFDVNSFWKPLLMFSVYFRHILEQLSGICSKTYILITQHISGCFFFDKIRGKDENSVMSAQQRKRYQVRVIFLQYTQKRPKHDICPYSAHQFLRQKSFNKIA